GGLMRDDLRANGLVPTTEPYTALGYTYVGTGSGVSISPLWLDTIGDRAIVDWVVLEVRSNTAPYSIIRSKPAILLRNGEVWDTDGDRYINFGILPAVSRRLAIRHRNHLGVMTGGLVLLYEQPLQNAIDLRLGSLSVYGTDARMQIGTTRCLWPGDANFNGQVKYAGAANDRDAMLAAIGGINPTATVSGQYRLEDVNMDGVVKYAGANNDRDVVLQTIGGSVPTATRTQQLP
ncbi:MAG: hypothetical protein KDB88_01725, partial [Flavobacteriales bacterium]|nr:hypothetical protein [Flavobacteriales bacterium]